MLKLVDILKRIGNENFTEYVINARIGGRVLDELENINERTKKDSETSFKMIKENYSDVLNKTKKQLDATIEIQSQFKGLKKPLFIKGATAAILCNSKKNIRRSGDIDLFYNDIPLLKSKLILLGYREINASPSAHEDSFFEKNGIFIEIHKFFPILMEPQYPEENFENKRQLQMPDIKIRELEYTALLAHSITVSNKVATNITVTDPAMTVFLLSAHMYKNMFWEPYRISKIRLSEILEINDLIHLPSFDFSELNDIAEQFQAKHILNYAFSIMSETLNENMPEKFDKVEKPLIKLMNASYSPYVITDSSFFASLPYMSFDKLLERIGYNECVLGENYYTNDLSNVFCASMTDQTNDFYFKLDFTENGLNICFAVNSDIQNFDNFFVLANNNYFAHVWLDDYPQQVRVYGSNVQYDISIKSGFYKANICLPASEHSVTSMVLAMGKIDSHMHKSVTVLPIKLKL